MRRPFLCESDAKGEAAIEAQNGGVVQPADLLRNAVAFERHDFICHDLGGASKASGVTGIHINPKEGCILKLAAQQTDQNAGMARVEHICLNDHGRTRLAVITGGSDNHQIAPFHPSQPSSSTTDPIKSSIWARPTKDGTGVFYNVQFQRSYRSDETTQYTDSFNQDDLLNVAQLAKRAEQWIADKLAA